MRKPFIMIAPTGARRTKADHPALPISIEEIVKTTAACVAEGAHGLHLHVRDDDGQHTLDAGRYLEAITELALALPDIPVQITTEAAGLFDVQSQLKCLTTVKPAWASISVREIDRSPDLADRVYGTCEQAGTKVQHIVYGLDDLALLYQRMQQGIIRADQTDVLFVLGRYTKNQTSLPSDIPAFIDAKQGDADWMVCAFGVNEHACLTHAAQQGGHIRVGFENSLSDEGGGVHDSNEVSVGKLCRRLSNL